MILSRYLLLEVAKTQFAVFFVLMTIFISQKFVGILGDASEGGIPGSLVMTFIALKAPELAGMLMPLSMFLGILLAYGRIYADSEMTVLHACGVSEWYIVRLTLILSFLTAIITGIFTLYLSPMAADYELQVKAELAADSGLSSLVAGRFQITGNDKAVVFVHEKTRNNNELSKVFVAQLPDRDGNEQSVINSSLVYAEKGLVLEDDSGAQKLSMENGYRYQSDINTGEFRTVSFGKYHIEIQEKKVAHKRRKLSALSTAELFEEDLPESRAAIQWRFAFPIACLILTLIAVPLSVVNPRQGKFAKMLPALLLFLGYFLLLTAMRSALEGGSVPSNVGLWPIHVVALVLGITLLMQERSSGKKMKAKVKRKKGNAA